METDDNPVRGEEFSDQGTADTSVEIMASAGRVTSKVPIPSLQQAALWPAIVCLREALLSQWQSNGRPSIDRLDGLVGYLVRIPGLHLREMEPLMAWKHEVGVWWGGGGGGGVYCAAESVHMETL